MFVFLVVDYPFRWSVELIDGGPGKVLSKCWLDDERAAKLRKQKPILGSSAEDAPIMLQAKVTSHIDTEREFLQKPGAKAT